jgi:NAD-dependent deacetylase
MKIAVLSGAGISAESGIETFRDIKNGLWYNYNVDEVATLEGWEKKPELVLEFHNMLREKCRDIKPNSAHLALAELEKEHDVTIVTQNVDDLHEKAGSTKILHIHGEIMKGRDSMDKILHVEDNINIGDLDEFDEQIRPHTVLFGEEPFYWFNAVEAIIESDILIVIGTSFSIGYIPTLVSVVENKCKVYYIDPKPDLIIERLGILNLEVRPQKAGVGVPQLVKEILE